MKPRVLLKRARKQKTIVVTAADYSHERSLIRLIDSLITHEPFIEIVVYDLGLSKEVVERIKKLGVKKRLTLEKFEFFRYPKWMNINTKNNGEYAWKPIIIQQVLESASSPSVIFWLDAGCILIKSIDKIVDYASTYGFWAPYSEGQVKQWCHPEVLSALEVEDWVAFKKNLAAGLIAFSTENINAKQLLKSWQSHALIRRHIGPKQSNRSNHRQDQSLLSILAHQRGLAPGKIAASLWIGRLLKHQDVG